MGKANSYIKRTIFIVLLYASHVVFMINTYIVGSVRGRCWCISPAPPLVSFGLRFYNLLGT